MYVIYILKKYLKIISDNNAFYDERAEETAEGGGRMEAGETNAEDVSRDQSRCSVLNGGNWTEREGCRTPDSRCNTN